MSTYLTLQPSTCIQYTGENTEEIRNKIGRYLKLREDGTIGSDVLPFFLRKGDWVCREQSTGRLFAVTKEEFRKKYFDLITAIKLLESYERFED